ncbi:hypothetical protein [Mycoplasma amphoriforme]|uniref:hypothetical protein n=1 Tax=Mycoplasma amphoriforme TaxID=273136 RepID=UPI0031BB9C73
MAKKDNDSKFQKLILEQLKELAENVKSTNKKVDQLDQKIDKNKMELKKEIEKTNQKIDNNKIELKKQTKRSMNWTKKLIILKLN